VVIKFTGIVPDEELIKYYQKAKVYQLSEYEGLPNALCEAMLCECVPAGTRYCGIPTAIGDTGMCLMVIQKIVLSFVRIIAN